MDTIDSRCILYKQDQKTNSKDLVMPNLRLIRHRCNQSEIPLVKRVANIIIDRIGKNDPLDVKNGILLDVIEELLTLKHEKYQGWGNKTDNMNNAYEAVHLNSVLEIINFDKLSPKEIADNIMQDAENNCMGL